MGIGHRLYTFADNFKSMYVNSGVTVTVRPSALTGDERAPYAVYFHTDPAGRPQPQAGRPATTSYDRRTGGGQHT